MTETTNNEYVAKPTPTIIQILKAIALLRESPVGLLGGGIVALFFILAILAPVIAPYDPNLPILPFALPGTDGPNGEYFLFGTDHLGRDIFSPCGLGRTTGLVLCEPRDPGGLSGRNYHGPAGRLLPWLGR